jgi:transposase
MAVHQADAPNKPWEWRVWMTGAYLTVSFASCDQARRGAIRPKDTVALSLSRAAFGRTFLQQAHNKIKQCWRIATRYDKLAINSLAFIKLVSIRIRPRVYESAPFS